MCYAELICLEKCWDAALTAFSDFIFKGNSVRASENLKTGHKNGIGLVFASNLAQSDACRHLEWSKADRSST